MFSFCLSADKDIQEEWLHCSETVMDNYSQNASKAVCTDECVVIVFTLFLFIITFFTARRTIFVFHLQPLIDKTPMSQ